MAAASREVNFESARDELLSKLAALRIFSKSLPSLEKHPTKLKRNAKVIETAADALTIFLSPISRRALNNHVEQVVDTATNFAEYALHRADHEEATHLKKRTDFARDLRDAIDDAIVGINKLKISGPGAKNLRGNIAQTITLPITRDALMRSDLDGSEGTGDVAS